MKELRQELEQAYKLVAALPVSGDAVDVVSGIRAHLRRAWALAEKKAGDTEEKEGHNG